MAEELHEEEDIELDLTGSVQAVLRIEREKKDVSWKDVAKTAGIPYNTLLRYVHDAKNVPLWALERIAPALGKEASEIVRLAESGEISLRAKWTIAVFNNPVPPLPGLETAGYRHDQHRPQLVAVG